MKRFLVFIVLADLLFSPGCKSPATPKNLPTIVSFYAIPETIYKGESTTLYWSTLNAATAIIDQGVGSVSASGNLGVSPTQTTTYTFTVGNPDGTVTATTTVAVKEINLSGDWNGTFQIPKFNESGSISFTLSQEGNQLTGTFTTTTARYGKISGNISGQTLTGTLTFQDWCRGSSSLTSTVSSDGRKMTGNANANDCLGNYSISFSVTKK